MDDKVGGLKKVDQDDKGIKHDSNYQEFAAFF